MSIKILYKETDELAGTPEDSTHLHGGENAKAGAKESMIDTNKD